MSVIYKPVTPFEQDLHDAFTRAVACNELRRSEDPVCKAVVCATLKPARSDDLPYTFHRCNSPADLSDVYRELKRLQQAPVIVLDPNKPFEEQWSHLPGTINDPSELKEKIIHVQPAVPAHSGSNIYPFRRPK